MTIFRPMLATDFDEKMLRFPYYASPKLDGIRCLVIEGRARTRSMKPFPNLYVDAWFRDNAALLNNLDGELIIGDPTASDCFRKTTSGLMSIDGRPEFQFYVFDTIDPTGRKPFGERLDMTLKQIEKARKPMKGIVDFLVHQTVETMTDLSRFEEIVLGHGYEGVMLRHPGGRYKQGRATLNEGTLLKVKRYRVAEAIIIGSEEQMFNGNMAYQNELGRTKRSSALAGMVGKGTLGSLLVRGAPGEPFEGVEFGLGTGIDDDMRLRLWRVRAKLPGLRVRYNYFDIGVKDAPRHPVFSDFVGVRVPGT